MHGCHQLNDEYKISAERIDLSHKSSAVFSFKRSKLKSESSPKCKNSSGYMKKLVTAMTATILLVMGLIRTASPSSLLKIYAGSQMILAYLSPRLLMVKRSFIPADVNVRIIPNPFHLVLALGSLDEAEHILIKDPAAQLIVPRHQQQHEMTFNSTFSDRIWLERNSTTIFESLAYSLCDTYVRTKRYPTKLTVTGKSKISNCILGRYRKAFKFLKEMISFRATNSSRFSNHISECSSDNNDYFDCKGLSPHSSRQRYSQLCPDLAPILLACGNRVALERALEHKPPWAQQIKKK